MNIFQKLHSQEKIENLKKSFTKKKHGEKELKLKKPLNIEKIKIKIQIQSKNKQK